MKKKLETNGCALFSPGPLDRLLVDAKSRGQLLASRSQTLNRSARLPCVKPPLHCSIAMSEHSVPDESQQTDVFERYTSLVSGPVYFYYTRLSRTPNRWMERFGALAATTWPSATWAVAVLPQSCSQVNEGRMGQVDSKPGTLGARFFFPEPCCTLDPETWGFMGPFRASE